MKQLTCEVCGGNDLLKQDGVFACQSCGCKYSAEEVKKLMVQISEPVKVQGVNTIDEEIKNIDALIQMGNLKYAEQLLGEIEKKSPRNPCVWLSYAKFIFAKTLTNNSNSKDSVATKCKECRNCLDIYYNNALKFAGKEIDKIKKEFETLYNKVSTFENSANSKLSKVLSEINLGEYGCYEWNQWNDNYDRPFCFCGNEKNLYYFKDRTYALEYSYKHWFNNTRVTSKDREFSCFVHKIKEIDSQGNIIYDNEKFALIDERSGGHYQNVRVDSNYSYRKREHFTRQITAQYTGYEQFVKQCVDDEPIKMYLNSQNNIVVSNKYGKEFVLKRHSECNSRNFTIDYARILPKKDGDSGCYIATSVYGTYDCPEVWTLRRYRDCTLAQTWYGRAFIKTYYAISPTLVKWFGNTTWFQNFWKNKLDGMVCNLKNKGFEDKPYDDRKW